ncbi:hypothetical protein ABK040_004933 [Willaertia magna]
MSNPTLRLGGRKQVDNNAPPNPIMVSQLMDMGFSKYKCEYALSTINNRSIDEAIQYIYDHFDQLEKEEAEVINESLNPTSTVNTTNTLSTINATSSTDDNNTTVNTTTSPSLGGSNVYVPTNPNKLKGDSLEAKLAFRERERLKEIERVKKEKLEEKKRVKALKDQMKREKEEKEKRLLSSSSSSSSGSSTNVPSVKDTATTSTTIKPTATTTPSSSNTTKTSTGTTTSGTTTTGTSSSSSEVKKALIQVRLPSGAVEKVELTGSNTLSDLYHAVSSKLLNKEEEAHSIINAFPRKEYTMDEFESNTLQMCGLVPRGSVVIQPSSSKGVVKKATDTTLLTNNDNNEEEEDEDMEDTTTNTPSYTTGGSGGHVLGGGSSSGSSGSSLLHELVEKDELTTIYGKNSKEIVKTLICDKHWILNKNESKDSYMIYNNSSNTNNNTTIYSSNIYHSNESLFLSSDGSANMTSANETLIGSFKLLEGNKLEIIVNNMTLLMKIENITNEILIVKKIN